MTERYGILLDNGTLITDSEWLSPGDVMGAAHGHGVKRMPGRLVRVSEEIERVTRELQAEGPDEFPEGYYRHLALQKLGLGKKEL